MRSLRFAVVAALVGLAPPLAFAGVVVNSPAPGGVAGKVPAIQKPGQNLPPQTPASADQPAVSASGTDGVPAAKPETSAQIWEQAIKAPPEGKISMRSKEAMEKAIVAAYEAGKTQSLPPISGTNGEVLYAFGQSLPTLVTAPLHTSIIALRAGMKGPKEVGLSPAYWNVEPLMAGNQPELAITPRFAGLHGDLVVTGTSPHGKPMNYVIEVTSDANQYTPIIGFYYPEAITRTWKQQAAATQAFHQKVNDETVAVLPSINAADLNFQWKIECAGGGWFSSSDCGSIKPARVFDDGRQTFIQFQPGQGSHGGIPSILAENAAGQNAIINTQFRDGYYIVDGVPHKILLLAGKGSDGRVVKLIRQGD